MNIETALSTVDRITTEIVVPQAARVDAAAEFPSAAMDALRDAGLLALISATEVGGHGHGLRAAALVVERLAQACGSTAMVTCMHYAGTAVIEKHGGEGLRREIASGRHLATLAFSEAGSRSHFWAPTSTATRTGDSVTLDARKSWVTSARNATLYVWSSRPASAEGYSSIWVVPNPSSGLVVQGSFDGIGLRGNDSAPVHATGVSIGAGNVLGEDGKGFDVMMGTVLPIFSVMNAACSIGIAERSVAGAAAHCGSVKHEHLGTSLADLPTIRAYLARMKIQTDATRMLWMDTLSALESGRADAMLRVLEVKAAAGEAAIDVSTLAMRVCGGAAFRKEVGVERAFRDAQAASIMAPTTDQLYDFIGKAVCGLPLF